LPLVQLVNALALAAMMALLTWSCRRASGSLGVASAISVFTFFGLWQVLTIRPQTFSLLLFVLLNEILRTSEQRGRLLLLPPLLLALWVNLHGAFPLGLMLIGCHLTAAAIESGRARGWRLLRDRRTAALALCLAASAAATLINPYGWRVYEYVTTTSSAAAARRIDEWLAPGLDLLIGKVWVFSLVLVLLAFALSPRRPATRDLCLMLCFLPLACGSARMVVWWLLIIAPILAATIAALPVVSRLSAKPEPPSFASLVVFGLMALMVTFSLPGLERHNPLLGPSRRAHLRKEGDLTAAAEQVAARNPAARIFSRFEWGEFLTWFLGQKFPVFMDGRIEIFPDEVWSEYSSVTVGRTGWQDILDRYRVDYLLLDASYHATTGLLPQVERSKEWKRAFQAGDAILFVRRNAG
jgi:hypothetical protein